METMTQTRQQRKSRLLSGTVVRVGSRYGFIKAAEGPDVFFSLAVVERDGDGHMPDIVPGGKVLYEIRRSSDAGPAARFVRVVRGGK